MKQNIRLIKLHEYNCLLLKKKKKIILPKIIRIFSE